MILAINTLKKIFALHTKTQDYHLKHPKCATLNVIMFPLKELLMLTNEIILTNNGPDILRPLGI